jgi:hypothetical protein
VSDGSGGRRAPGFGSKALRGRGGPAGGSGVGEPRNGACRERCYVAARATECCLFRLEGYVQLMGFAVEVERVTLTPRAG